MHNLFCIKVMFLKFMRFMKMFSLISSLGNHCPFTIDLEQQKQHWEKFMFASCYLV